MTASVEVPAKKTRKPKKAAQKAAAPAESTSYRVGMFASARLIDGERYNCGVIGTDGETLILLAPDGSEHGLFPNELLSCTMVPVAPLRPGDEVMVPDKIGLNVRPYFFRGIETDGLARITPDEVSLSASSLISPSHLYVYRRTDLADLRADVGVALPGGATPAGEHAALTGWFQPHKGGMRHWMQEGRALCGRTQSSVPTIQSTDPHDPAMAVNVCRRCAPALAKLYPPLEESPEASGVLPLGHRASFPYDSKSGWVRAEGTLFEYEGGAVGGGRYLMALYDLEGGVEYVHAWGRDVTYIGPSTEDEQLGVITKENVPAPERPGTPEPAPTPVATAPEFVIPHVEPLLLGRQELPWNKLLGSDLNPRKVFAQTSLEELAVNIHERGVLQNLVARPHATRPGFYEIVAGERRYRAVGLLVKGLEVREGEARTTLTVPANHPLPVLVQELSDLELLKMATAENLHRGGISPLEEADAFVQMLDRGATIDELHDELGIPKRTITRRVQIGRHLIPVFRELLGGAGTQRITLAQAEVLALATPGVQEHLHRSQFRNGMNAPAETLKKLIHEHLFQRDHAQFPSAWYTGDIVEADLFGDLPAYFKDFDQAIKCQIRHAVALAEKDISKGATFADVAVRAEALMWNYREQDGKGTYYWINSKTGELRRYQDLAKSSSYSAPDHQFVGAKPVPVHETPKASAPKVAAPNSTSMSKTSAPAPSTPPVVTTPEAAPPVLPSALPPRTQSPSYPRLMGQRLLSEALIAAAYTHPQLALALDILGCLLESNPIHTGPVAKAAIEAAVRHLDGLLICDAQGQLKLGQSPEDDSDIPTSAHLLPALLSLPEDVLITLQRAFSISLLLDMTELEDRAEAACALPVGLAPFVLTEGFLEGCNDAAIADLWDDAGMGNRDNTSRSYLVSLLLEDAPKLAAAGFLPRIFRDSRANGGQA